MRPAPATAFRIREHLGLVRLLAALAAPVVLPGCLVASEPPFVGGYATIYATSVPPDIYAYPHVWFEGGYAYLVGNRWYYPASGGWVVLRGEPPTLFRYRQAYGWRGTPYGAAFRQAAPPAPPLAPTLPPPAERVR
jgi:hypothetical protein